ncbi:MAG TPA: FtsX-like permease family protein [Anaeromyxobacter sp.]|nr:FtsX-like permease family protein [Anaeromyxobacter sp.]
MAPPLLRIAARSARRNLRHSAGSVLAIAAGFVALALFQGYLSYLTGDMLVRILDRFMVGEVLVERPGFAEALEAGEPTGNLPSLGAREQAFVEEYLASRKDELRGRTRVRLGWGVASTGKATTQFISMAYDVEDGARLRGRFAWDALAGRPLQHAAPDSVVLGRGLGTLLECEPATSAPAATPDGFPIAEERPLACRRPRVQLVATTVSGQLNAVEADVVGIVDGGMRDQDLKYLAMPVPLAQQLSDTDEVTYYSIALRDPSAARAFARDLDGAARARGVDVHCTRYLDHFMSEEFRRGLSLLAGFERLVGVLVVLIAGMTVLTTMAKAVAERTREIGTLRSLGFVRRQIVALFALEAGILAAIASALGLAVTVAVTALVNAAGVTYDAGIMAQPFALQLDYAPRTWVAAAAFLAAVAALAAVVPARRAARARIPDALTHV